MVRLKVVLCGVLMLDTSSAISRSLIPDDISSSDSSISASLATYVVCSECVQCSLIGWMTLKPRTTESDEDIQSSQHLSSSNLSSGRRVRFEHNAPMMNTSYFPSWSREFDIKSSESDSSSPHTITQAADTKPQHQFLGERPIKMTRFFAEEFILFITGVIIGVVLRTLYSTSPWRISFIFVLCPRTETVHSLKNCEL